jgi:hypothetical protein
MLFFWLIPVVILAILAVVWFTRRVAETSPSHTDSDVITTDQAEQEERNEGLR